MGTEELGEVRQSNGLIHKKVLEVLRATKKLRKGRTSQQGYKYWGIEDLVPQFREHLIESGLYLIQGVAAPPIRESRQSNKGTPLIFCVVNMWYRLYAEDGSWIEGGACGEAQDTIDKAEPKAETCAIKNFLKRLLQIETEPQSLDTDRGGEEIGKGPAAKHETSARKPTAQKPPAVRMTPEAAAVYAQIMGLLNKPAFPADRVDWKAKADTEREDVEALKQTYSALQKIIEGGSK
jgi:hypothetical protein